MYVRYNFILYVVGYLGFYATLYTVWAQHGKQYVFKFQDNNRPADLRHLSGTMLTAMSQSRGNNLSRSFRYYRDNNLGNGRSCLDLTVTVTSLKWNWTLPFWIQYSTNDWLIAVRTLLSAKPSQFKPRTFLNWIGSVYKYLPIHCLIISLTGGPTVFDVEIPVYLQ